MGHTATSGIHRQRLRARRRGLKNPDQPFDYFEELLRRIQDIRTSERRFYQKLPAITPPVLIMIPLPRKASPFLRQFKTNCTGLYGMTAAELIHSRTDSGKPYMGLTSWRGAKVRKQDVGIAKNYLSEKELLALNNLVEQYLLFAKRQARLRRPMHMTDWIANKLDAFLRLNEGNILTHAGSISHELPIAHAEQEYDKFHRQQQLEVGKKESDFDKAVRVLTE